jgi:hypothetical protein
LSGLRDHPEVSSCSTYVYPVTNINKPAFTLKHDARPGLVGFDPVAQQVYAHSFDAPLVVFSTNGIKKKEYPFRAGSILWQYLVHPEGRKLLLLSGETLDWLELSAQ